MKTNADKTIQQNPPPGREPHSYFAGALGGGIVGGLIGIVADPLTAVVGALACAIVCATGGFDTDGRSSS